MSSENLASAISGLFGAKLAFYSLKPDLINVAKAYISERNNRPQKFFGEVTRGLSLDN